MLSQGDGEVTARRRAASLGCVIDLHAHLLPGIDDGPDTLAQSVALARAFREGGVRTVACTPHVHPHYPTTSARMLGALEALRAAVAAAGVDLRILPGGEISLKCLPRLDDETLRAFSLGGGGRWLLLEMPFRGWPLGLPETLRDLEIRGFGAVLAHPERADAVQRAPDRLRDIVGRGALCQLTASSFTGEHGPAARRCAEALLRGGFAHILASDAHAVAWRPPGLEEGLEAAARSLGVWPETLGWMVVDGPRLVAEGKPVNPPKLVPSRTLRAPAAPARPASAPRRRRSSGGPR